MQNITFNKDYSIKSSIANAWKIFALNWKCYLKNTWVFLFIAGMSQAFLLEMTIQYVCQHALPALRIFQNMENTDLALAVAIPNVYLAIYWLLSLIIAIIGTYLCTTRIVRLIHEYRNTEKFPNQLPLFIGETDRLNAFKLFAIGALFFLLSLILIGLITWVSKKVSFWFLLLLPILVIYIWSTANVARVCYAIVGNSFMTSLKYALKRSLRQPFIVQILTLIPTFVIGICLTLPLVIYILAEIASTDSLLRGDSFGIPSFVPFFFYILNSVCLTAMSLVKSWRLWALSLNLNTERVSTSSVKTDFESN